MVLRFNPIMPMKTLFLAIITLSVAVACRAQPASAPPPFQRPHSLGVTSSAVAPDTANYLIRIEWKEPKSDPKFLEVLTGEGRFSLDTIQKNPVKINGNDVPATLKFTGTLDAISDEKGRLELFLGRTVPYVTGLFANGGSTYSQLSVGLQSSVNVKFGKSMTIQNDENGEISVLVKRIAD